MIKACRACVKACGDRHRQRRVHAEDAARASKTRPPRYWTAAALALHLRANKVDDRTVARFSRTTGAALLVTWPHGANCPTTLLVIGLASVLDVLTFAIARLELSSLHAHGVAYRFAMWWTHWIRFAVPGRSPSVRYGSDEYMSS